MSKRIQVGEYVKTYKGYIARITDDLGKDKFVRLRHYEIDRYTPQGGFILYDDEIKKHSFNIIDLIEVRRLCEWH